MDSGDVKMLKKLLVVLLALTLIATPALAVCPATWNDPNLTCITTQNWHDFVNNWTFWNASTWSNFNNYDTLAQANARNVSIWNNFGNYATVTNVSSANTSIWNNFQNYETVVNASAMNASIWYALGNVSAPVDYTGLFFQNGTRIMTGSLNAGGFNISNVSTPVVSTDAATKGYADTGISSAESIISGWIQTNNSATLSTVNSWIQQNSSATLQTADSHIASNLSTVSTWIQSNNSATLSTAGIWISQNNSATLATADSHIASNMSGVLHLTGGTMIGRIDAGGYNLSNVSAPVSNGDAVNLNYFNTHSTGGSGTVSNTSLSTANNVTVFSDATGRNISDSYINYTKVVQSSQIRTKLTSATTYYVANATGYPSGWGAGSNSNNGLSQSTPFLTLQYAYDYIAANDDCGGQTVTIQLAGTAASPQSYVGLYVSQPWIGGGNIVIQGDVTNTNMASVTITSGSLDGSILNGSNLPGTLTINYVTLTSTYAGVFNSGTGKIAIGYVTFGACTNYGMLSSGTGARIVSMNSGQSISVTGSMNCLIGVWNGGLVQFSGATQITLTGTLTFGTSATGYGILTATYGGVIYGSYTFTGTYTISAGQWEYATYNGVIYTFGSTKPTGSSAGTTITGGQIN